VLVTVIESPLANSHDVAGAATSRELDGVICFAQ